MLLTALITLTAILGIAALSAQFAAGQDYVPNRDVDLAAWALNFDTIITAAPTDYGLTGGQASAFNALRTAYSAALALATDPSTRTPTAVAAKDTARNSLVANARQLAMIARAYPAITDELLASAGLTVPDPVPSPVPAPTSTPQLSQMSVASLTHTLKFKDSVLSNPRSKPQGAVALLLWTKTTTGAPADVSDCVFVGMFSRSPIVVTHDPADAGKLAYYLARWVTAKGLEGPNSDLFSLTVQA